MRHCRYNQIFCSFTLLFSLLLLTSLSASLKADDLPSGLPDDLSDSSPYNPCIGRLYGAQPPRCPWYFQADALFLKRDRVDSVPIAAVSNDNIDVVFSTLDLASPFRVGPRFLLGHSFMKTRWQIDATYYEIKSWDDTAAIRDGSGNLLSPFTNFGQDTILSQHEYDFNRLVTVREISQLRNIELNLRYTLPMPHDCLTPKLILGLRYMDIQEDFNYFSQFEATDSTSIDTRTTNDLFGPQIGGEFYFFAHPQCWIDLSIKGALCANRALQDTTGTLRDDDLVTSEVASRRARDVTAFVGDLDLDLVWQITPRLITRIGYQAIWVNNIAMGARNFAPPADILENGPPQIDTIGRAVYHGPHIGLEFTW